jgi:hypothetical protein
MAFYLLIDAKAKKMLSMTIAPNLDSNGHSGRQMTPKIKSILTILCAVLCYPVIGWSADVTVDWDPNIGGDAAGYRLFAREAGERYNYARPEWQGAATQCTVTGFDEYESYYFVIRAVDDEGNESGYSNEIYWDPSGSGTNGNPDGDGGGSGGGGGCFIRSLFGD